jgi:hypothetical protein
VNVRRRSRRSGPWLRRVALKTFVWILLAIFVLTSVGVALVTFTAR